MAGAIVIRGARVHNLKNIDLEIPRDRLVVITGVSGSGKSSLAFDTLYAEGQRRYLESLAADARQLLQQMEKPDVDAINGLSPTIAIQQNTGLVTPRSTVGTMTDIYDYLRLLFARVGQPTCFVCGREVRAYAVEQIVDQLLELPAQTRILVLAPISVARPSEVSERLRELERQGFARVMVNGRMFELGDELQCDGAEVGQLDLVVDRLVLRDGIEKRLADSLEVASRHGDQVIKIRVLGAHETDSAEERVFSQRLVCVNCGTAIPELTPSLFSFNSPQGACATCKGLGVIFRRSKRHKRSHNGSDAEICPDCGGTRLNRQSRSVRIRDHDISQVAAKPIVTTIDFFNDLQLTEERRTVGQKIVAEIISRLRCMAQLGLDYLSLDRSSVTLSGGELQRVRLATQIGSGLAGVLYVLDEPSIGLHQKDNAQLVALLKQLRNMGNSVVVVEHDPETILAADYVIDMGPGAGIHGGHVVAQGSPSEIIHDGRSLTGRYLARTLKISPAVQRHMGTGRSLTIKSASARNLKNITVEIPIGAMTCVTGVSGAGKSTLVMELLYHGVAQRLQKLRVNDLAFSDLVGWKNFDRVIGVDQTPIGRTSRSNPATYTGVYDHLRDLFAQLPEARLRGYKAERFSFNVSGGRCEACGGEGITRVEMYFLPELFLTCAVCKGRRYNRETLQVKYKGLSISDILDLTVDQALELLNNMPPIYDRLRILREVGLGYLRLGQSATTLSGGEAQRIKLARELARKSTGRSLYMLDEPTTGLHFDDVKKLLELLNRLTDLGNTIVVVEHNLDVIKCADYVIDLGPEGGARGGEVVAQGTPEEIAQMSHSITGQYLKPLLEPRPVPH
ncbi:MAG: excinuclease ABC subunit A [Deltaproteobacteria bacterium]|nr:MAG: excinuclease ABC subunit A [Deltaproteobacteria bacterium]